MLAQELLKLILEWACRHRLGGLPLVLQAVLGEFLRVLLSVNTVYLGLGKGVLHDCPGPDILEALTTITEPEHVLKPSTRL